VRTRRPDPAQPYHLPLAAAFVPGRFRAVGDERDGHAIARGLPHMKQ